jgi:hypothetical protein
VTILSMRRSIEINRRSGHTVWGAVVLVALALSTTGAALWSVPHR